MGLPRFVRNDKNDEAKIARKSGEGGRNLDKMGRCDIYYLPIERKVKVSKVPGLKRTVGIRQCNGGGYPRPIFASSPTMARLTDFLAYVSEEAPQPLEIATPRQVGARNETPIHVIARLTKPAEAIYRDCHTSLAMTTKVGAGNPRKFLGLVVP
jgi:hypothetical protein